MYQYQAQVLRVVDGDTVDCLVDLGFHVKAEVRFRLLGVDTPERGHPEFDEAKQKLAKLLRDCEDVNGYVQVRSTKTGKYGRWLVEIDSGSVNDLLADRWPYGG